MRGKSFPPFPAGRTHSAGGVSPKELSDGMREPSTCTVTNLLTLDPNSRPRLSSNEDPSNPHARSRVCRCRAARTLARSRMLVTLALGDSRLVYAVICPAMDDLNSSGASIDESPRILESLRESTASLMSASLSRRQRKEIARVVFPALRYSSLDLLTVARWEQTWPKFKSRTSCTDLWLRVSRIMYI